MLWLAFDQLVDAASIDVSPLIDGMLLITCSSGFSGESLINEAVESDAARNTDEEIETYISVRVRDS